jgi:hypothetical protein
VIGTSTTFQTTFMPSHVNARSTARG